MFLKTVSSFLLMGTLAQAAPILPTQDEMLNGLNAIQEVYQTSYAMQYWKKDHLNYDIVRAFDVARAQVNADPNFTLKQYQRALLKVLNDMNDYHVSIRFVKTERATLPLTIRGAEGRYFIAYIDRDKLSEAAFPFHIGDEVIEFDGHSVDQEIQNIRSIQYGGVETTDQALAELTLTARSAARGLDVPQGPVVLTMKVNSTGAVRRQQLIWSYAPEDIQPDAAPASLLANTDDQTSLFHKQMGLLKNPFLISVPSPEAESTGRESGNGNIRFRGPAPSPLTRPRDSGPNVNRVFQQPQMIWGGYEPKSADDSPISMIGSRKSYIPDLGVKLWESDDKANYHAYLFETANHHVIGYVRIPHYMGNATWVAEFAQLMEKMEKATDALVIDQINNPGGDLFYLYALGSLLTQQPLMTPKERMKITATDAMQFVQIRNQMATIKNDDEAKAALAADFGGYPVSYQTVEFLRNFSTFGLSQWNSGITFTSPNYIFGVDQINPYPGVTYSKPILLVINQLDFSGGDFFPAIMQDNHRVTVFGTRTAGAGGYVMDTTFPNRLGIQNFRVTGSIARRVNDLPIENLGVTPEISYDLTAQDFTSNFTPYRDAIVKAVEGLIK